MKLIIIGNPNIFAFPYCENDRLWRKMAGITPERYMRSTNYAFDECDNAYAKPSKPVFLDLLGNLHKKSSFGGMEEWKSSMIDYHSFLSFVGENHLIKFEAYLIILKEFVKISQMYCFNVLIIIIN